MTGGPVVLVGLRGSGKTTVGQTLAHRLGWPFADSDQIIENKTGQAIEALFRCYGEEGFREIEASVVAGLLKRLEQVVALGGGAILSEATRRRLAAGPQVVFLDAPTPVLAARIRHDPASPQRRPRLTNAASLEDEIETLRRHRLPIYAEVAHFRIDVSACTPSETADAILRWLRQPSAESSAGRPGT